MKGIHTELAGVEAQINAINAAMKRAAATPMGNGLNTAWLGQYADEVHNVRKQLLNTIGLQGDFGVQSMKVASQADRLTEMIQRQKFGLRDLIAEHKNLESVYQKQMSLQKSLVMQWGRNANGSINADLMTPRAIEDNAVGFKRLAERAGFYNQVLASVADQTIKWGKNTQWAGRQLTAGLSMPIAAAAAGTGALAYQVDKGLTQVVKVYGDATTAATTSDKMIRDATVATAKSMASAYGQSVNDSIEITSQLASSGKTGIELQEATAEVTRARTLGELNLQDAMKATITLQSVYNMNSAKLGETFNFMNSMENQTALTMQDFVVGIPKVSGVLKEFGGTVQDAGILLAGMKAAGIDAAEGANAIKSIAFKIIAPNQGSKDMFESLTGKSFEETMAGAEGVVERLQLLGRAMQGLGEEDRVGLIQKMFGLYQGSKTLGLLSQLTNESEQMTRAFEVAQGGAASWANTAGRELEKLQNSGWNRVKQQWELLKIELFEVGETFLQMGAPILKFFNDIITKFNDLPGPVKKFILVGAVITAMIGPIIMLAGLFGNLIGNIGKLTTFITGLMVKFKILNADQVIASRLAAHQSGLIMDETKAYQLLAIQINNATQALQKMALAQALSNAGLSGATRHPVTGNIVRKKQGGGYAPLNKQQQAAYLDLEQSAMPASGIVADNSAKTAKSWGNISASTKSYAVAGVAGTTAMVAPSGSLVSNISSAVLIGATLLPLLSKVGFLAKAVQTVGMNGKVAGALMSRSLGPVITKAKTLGSAFMGFVPALGPVGIAIAAVGVAAGAAYYVINKNIKKSREEYDQFNASAKTYADVIGFTYKQSAERSKDSGQAIDSLTEKTKKFVEANAGAAKEFNKMVDASEADKLRKAADEAMKARLHGATEEQAVEAAQIALRAMRSQISDKEVAFKLKGIVDLSDMNQVINQQIRGIQATINKAVQDGYDQSKSESFGRFFTGTMDINQGAASAIEAQANEMWNIFATASEREQPKMFERMRENVVANQKNMFEQLKSEHAKEFAKYGIDSAAELAAFTKAGLEDSSKPGASNLNFDASEIEAWSKSLDAANRYVVTFGKNLAIPEEELKGITDPSVLRDMSPWLKKLGIGMQDVGTAQADWTDFVNESKTSVIKWSDAEMLARLNLHRRRAGLEDATSVEQGFSDAVVESTQRLIAGSDAAKQAAADHKAFVDAMSGPIGLGIDAGATSGDGAALTGSMRDSFAGAMDTVYSEASYVMDQQNKAVLDGIQKRADDASEVLDAEQDKMEDKFDAQNKAFENRWDAKKKAIENTYKTQIDNVEAAIKAEQDAEDIRQKIFEAEKRRIERLADLYNRNIDISMAINSGNLDEAAKLSNDAQSAQEGWLVDDAAAASGDSSNANIDALNKKKDALSAAKDNAMELADAQKEAEQDALKATQEAEKKKFDIRKKNAAESVRNEEDAARAKQEANKRALDRELALLKAHVPQNEAQLKAHIDRVVKAYDTYGGVLVTKGKGWGSVVGTALKDQTAIATTKMANDIAWAQLGKVAADKMTQGAFNMNLNEFMKWVMTGETPKNYQAPTAFTKSDVAKYNRMGIRVAGVNSSGGLTMHSGGVIGKDKGARTGFSGNNLSQSEVMINALKGESVLNRGATRALGTDFVDMANKGMIPKNIGGPDMLSGLGGMMTALMGGALRKSMAMGILSRGVIRKQVEMGAAGMDYTATGAGAGKYGGSMFTQEQLNNAAVIASTGKSMGASSRDIIIALMTAMQESTLRNLNYGDRDSLGLFQQRSAWGSAADRTNPAKAARMFFDGGAQGQRGLFDFPERGKMTLGQAAQAVQVSAYPGLYDQWSDEASAIMNSLKFSSTGGFSEVAAAGGWVRPANGPRTSPFGYRIHPITGERKLHAGSDIGAPGGAVIRAAKAGKVISAGWNGGYGNYTVIDHGNGDRTAYAHQSRFNVSAGQTVKAGQTIGYVGTTGASTGNHLHFEYLKNGVRVNPGTIIPGLKTGGFAMSDGLANLHQGEAVIPAKLTEQFKKNVAESNSFGYNVTMNFDGARFNSQIDFERGVENALLAIEKRKGANRKVS